MHLKKNILKRIFILLLVSLPIFVFGQTQGEKVKGNKIIELKTQKIEEFTSIEVGDLFEVALVLKANPTISIDADSNLHEHISVVVENGKLSIKANKTFTRFKRLYVEVGVNGKLTDIFVKGKAQLSAKSTLMPERLNVEVFENGKVNLNYKTTNASFFGKGKSKIVVNGEADIVSISVNDSAKIEANVVCRNFSASQNLKSQLILNGKAENSIFQITENSFLSGANFVSGVGMLSASGEVDSYINIADKLTLEASGKSSTYVLGNPLIDLKVFKEEATIYKTNKAPSTLKSFLR